jgi:hypothetical protein
MFIPKGLCPLFRYVYNISVLFSCDYVFGYSFEAEARPNNI